MYDAIVYTSNDSGVLTFERFAGSRWKVCDLSADGMRAVAEVRDTSSGGLLLRIQDASGSAGSRCGEGHIYPPPYSGQRLSLKVWVQNGANGSTQRPGYGSYTW
ncbi:hypothetical protein ABT354_24305 [Streptomyces sp. NPDC000594]|uniref:hypothetical protein n=1 Tax=Streptomyces sp. NPDC000594 TaxID=3154261 RepID=UPI0033257BAB